MPGQYEKDYYLEAMLIAAEGMIALARRYAAEAERLALLEKNPRRKRGLLEIARVSRRVTDTPRPGPSGKRCSPFISTIPAYSSTKTPPVPTRDEWTSTCGPITRRTLKRAALRRKRPRS